MKSNAQRQTQSRQARTAAGGKRFEGMLTAKAAAKLAAWVDKGTLGRNAVAIVNRLLERSRP